MIYIVREKKVILSMIELRKCKSMIYIYIYITYKRTRFQNKIPHGWKGLNARNIRGIKKASCASNGRLPSIDTEIVVA